MPKFSKSRLGTVKKTRSTTCWMMMTMTMTALGQCQCPWNCSTSAWNPTRKRRTRKKPSRWGFKIIFVVYFRVFLHSLIADLRERFTNKSKRCDMSRAFAFLIWQINGLADSKGNKKGLKSQPFFTFDLKAYFSGYSILFGQNQACTGIKFLLINFPINKKYSLFTRNIRN